MAAKTGRIDTGAGPRTLRTKAKIGSLVKGGPKSRHRGAKTKSLRHIASRSFGKIPKRGRKG